MSHPATPDSAPSGDRHSAHDDGSDGFVTSMALSLASQQQLQHVTIVDNPTDRTPTDRGTERQAALVVSLPARQTVPCSPVAVGDVLAEVLPLAAFRRPVRREVQGPELARRCAALLAVGAWRRTHPGASLEQDLAAAERISGEYGV